MTQISPDRILTISAAEYCDIAGTRLADYEARGFHVELPGEDSLDKRTIVERFALHVPPSAEAVVRYTATACAVRGWPKIYCSGTALQRKQSVTR